MCVTPIGRGRRNVSSISFPDTSGWTYPLVLPVSVVDFATLIFDFFWVLGRVIGGATGIESGRMDAPGGVAEEVPGGKPLPKRLEK